MKYYLAYGMNTNISSMATRCPAAQSLGKVTLKNHRLQFKYHCDVEFRPGAQVECALWLITDSCEKNLDQLEGYPFYYDKKEVVVEFNGQTVRPMIYYMKSVDTVDFPSQYYFDTVSQGYVEHNMSLDQLEQALDRVEECILSQEQQQNNYTEITPY